MEAWLILLGVMLPLAPTLEAIDRRLGAAPRRVRVEEPTERN